MRSLALLLLLFPVLALAQPADGSFQNGYLTLHYICVGNGDPVVILSGGPGLEPGYMNGLINPLSTHNRCILLEQRGTGRSQPAKVDGSTYSMDSYLGDLETLRKSLHLAQLNILGHSWGGMLAMAYAAKYPNNVHSLVLLSSGPMDFAGLAVVNQTIGKRLTKEEAADERFWTSPEQMKKDPNHAAAMALLAIEPTYFFDKSAATQFGAQMQGHKVDNPGVNGHAITSLRLSGYDVRVPLTAYHGPTFISQGTFDVIGDKTAEQIHETICGSEVLYIDKCGHFEWVEKPNVLLPPLEAFLAAHASPQDGAYTEGVEGPFFPGRFFGHHGGHGH